MKKHEITFKVIVKSSCFSNILKDMAGDMLESLSTGIHKTFDKTDVPAEIIFYKPKFRTIGPKKTTIIKGKNYENPELLKLDRKQNK